MSDSMNLTPGSSASRNLHAGKGHHAGPDWRKGADEGREVTAGSMVPEAHPSGQQPLAGLRGGLWTVPWTSGTARCFRTVPLARERGLRLPTTAWAATARPPGRPDGRLTADVDGRRSEGRRSPHPPRTAPARLKRQPDGRLSTAAWTAAQHTRRLPTLSTAPTTGSFSLGLPRNCRERTEGRAGGELHQPGADGGPDRPVARRVRGGGVARARGKVAARRDLGFRASAPIIASHGVRCSRCNRNPADARFALGGLLPRKGTSSRSKPRTVHRANPRLPTSLPRRLPGRAGRRSRSLGSRPSVPNLPGQLHRLASVRTG